MGTRCRLLNGTAYELVQFHFHAPSEHLVEGRAYPMEMHLVHQSAEGTLAVVGVLIEEGPHHAGFDPLWTALPQESGANRHLEDLSVDLDALLPPRDPYYRYEGSLTTPPCSEGVHWLVFAAPIHLSGDQLETFTSIIGANNRPAQPLHGRALVLSESL